MSYTLSEIAKTKLIKTLYRLQILSLPHSSLTTNSNIYVDDSGYVVITEADGAINSVHQLSFSGELLDARPR